MLGHASAHGRAVDVGPFDTEIVEHRDHVLCKDLGAVGAVGLVTVPRTAVIKGDRAAGCVKVLAYPGGVDPARTALFGESFGALISALTAIRAREAGM